MPGPLWIAAKTLPCREGWAGDNIARQGHQFYLPRHQVLQRGRLRNAFLFPGYIFVSIVNRQWHYLLSTMGVSYVLRMGAYPTRIARSFIEALQMAERDGMVELPPERFAQGQAVRVNQQESAWLGAIGLYQGRAHGDYVKVLLSILGKDVILPIREESLDPV